MFFKKRNRSEKKRLHFESLETREVPAAIFGSGLIQGAAMRVAAATVTVGNQTPSTNINPTTGRIGTIFGSPSNPAITRGISFGAMARTSLASTGTGTSSTATVTVGNQTPSTNINPTTGRIGTVFGSPSNPAITRGVSVSAPTQVGTFGATAFMRST